MQRLSDRLIQSPKFPLYVEQLEDILAKERRKRKAFYQMMLSNKVGISLSSTGSVE